MPYQILASTIHEKKISSSFKNNKHKISAPTWNVYIELPDTYYSVSDIQDYFQYITQKHETLTNTSPIITRK